MPLDVSLFKIFTNEYTRSIRIFTFGTANKFTARVGGMASVVQTVVCGSTELRIRDCSACDTTIFLILIVSCE